MQLKDLLPLIGVVLGALLTWLSGLVGQWLTARREEKKAIARALCELLEIRVRLLAIPKTAELLSEHFPIPPEAQTAIKITFSRLFPVDVDFAKRYGEAVTLVAACNPVLGFRLRSQDMVSPLLDTIRQLAIANSPASAAACVKVERQLMEHLNPHFEKLLLEMARMHGWLTWYRVRRILKRPLQLPDDLLETLKMQLPSAPQSSEVTTQAPATTAGQL